MPNPIKYSTGSETLTLKKGNFYIGTGDVSKGPTESTGYYNGITPPTSGYTIYLNKASQGPSIYVASTDNDLITITNQISGQNYTGVTQCLTYFASQTDKIVLNTDYPSIVTDGLVLNLDAGFVPSYPRSGTTWSDISLSGNSGTLVNGPTYSTNGGGSILFDGIDDYVKNVIPSTTNLSQGTILMIISHSYEGYYLQYYDRPNSRGAALNKTVPTGLVQIGVTYNGNNFFFHINGITTQSDIKGTYGYDATSPPSVGLFGRGRNTDGNSDNVFNFSFTLNSPQLKSTSTPDANTFFDNFTSSDSGYYTLSSGLLGKLPAVSRPRNLNGMIYNLQIYDRALSQTEIQQNYYSTLWRFLPNITQSNLILYLDATSTFSYVSGATSWYNLSSSGLTGTLVNGPTYSTENGGNITFDGTDDRVSIATYNLTSQFISFDFWIKVPSPLGNVETIFSDAAQSNTIGYIFFYFNDNGSLTYQFARSTTRSQVSVTPFSSGYVDTWVNLTITADYSSKEFKFYRNRQLLSTQTMTDAVSPLANRTRYIGSYSNSNSDSGKFSLSSFIWYSSILSATQVSQNFSSTVWRFLPNIVQNGLVLYVDAGYSFSYVSGATTWYDISSTNVNSTLTNGPTYSTNGGGSILLDGVDDYIPTNSTVSLTANWTVEAWFNLTSYPVLANVFSTAYGEGWYASSLFGGGKTIGWYLDSGWRSTAGNLYTTNQWYHLVAIVSGKNHYYYLNGVQVFSYTTNNTPSSVTFGNFGRIYGANQRYFPGYIALGRCYNRALTADEVLQNYNAQKSRFGL